MAWIEIQWPEGAPPRKYELGKGLIFGRSEEAEVILDDESVSAKHAWIREIDGRYLLIDLKSTNGVTIDGRSVEEARIHDGDTVCMADVVCRFHDPDEKKRREERAAREKAKVKRKEGKQDAEVEGEDPADPCPSCGYLVPGHLEFCPRCKQPMKGIRLLPEDMVFYDPERTRRFVRTVSSLAFAGGLVGPLLLGVGWALGIVLGVMVLSGYRAECDHQDIKMARRGILLGLLWLTVGLWIFVRFRMG